MEGEEEEEKEEEEEEEETRPDTRQSSRGRLGRGNNAKTARNSNM